MTADERKTIVEMVEAIAEEQRRVMEYDANISIKAINRSIGLLAELVKLLYRMKIDSDKDGGRTVEPI